MYLYELSDEEKLNNIVFAVDNLRQDLETGKLTHNWTIDQLKDYFRKNGVVLSNDDLYNMVQTDPLKNVVSNIKGKEVLFKGLPQQPATPEIGSPEKSKDVVAQMAKHALKK